MSKTILNHQNHLDIQKELAAPGEAEHSVCVRLAARFGCGKGRIYELRHGIHTPACCLPNAKPNLFNKMNPAAPAKNPTDDLPIVGFRMWNYTLVERKPRLASYNSHYGEWVPGQRYEATCAAGVHKGDAVPAREDCCGIHAYKSKEAADLLVRSSDGILGVVIMYGTVREHSEGYRARFVRPLCFSVKPALDGSEQAAKLFATRVKRTEALAKEYGVPIIAYEHVELYISEFGRVLPITPRRRGR